MAYWNEKRMKDLTSYITEKLIINKDSKISHLFKRGDKICFVWLRQPGNYRRREGCPAEVLIHFPITVEEINTQEKKITYYINDNRKLEFNYTKINKYGFAEDTNDKWKTTIILNKEDTISLLKELYKSLKRITLDVLTNKYFEDIHKLDFKYWNKEIRFTTIIGSSIIDLNRKVITDLINAYKAD